MSVLDLIGMEWPKFVVGALAGLLSGLCFGLGHAVYDIFLREPFRSMLSRWKRKA